MRLTASKILGCVLLLGSTSAQLTGITMMELLNSTKISPASKFVQLLSSSPDYQPIIDILSNPGNHTVFAPSDKVIESLETEFPGLFSKENRPTSSSVSGEQTSQVAAPTQSEAQSPLSTPDSIGPIHNNGDQLGSDPTVAEPESVLPMISPGIKEFSLPDIIYYHIVKGVYTIEKINNNTIVPTMLTNQTVDKSGNGAPLILGSNEKEYWAGNGLGKANITVTNIETSNGVIHIIDKLLVPPSSPSAIASYVSDLSFLNLFLMKNASFAQELNNATNITVFAPVNQALLGLDFSNMTMDQLSAMVSTHIVSGTYYASNLTQSDQSSNATETAVGSTTLSATATDAMSTASPIAQTSAEGVTPSDSAPASNPTDAATPSYSTNPETSPGLIAIADNNGEDVAKQVSNKRSDVANEVDSSFSFDEDSDDLSIQIADDGSSYVLDSENIAVDDEMVPDGVATTTIPSENPQPTATGDNNAAPTTTPEATTGDSSGKTLVSLSGTPLQIQAVNDTSFTVNGIPVVHSEILMSNGVLYLIGGVLQPNPPTSDGNQTTDGQGSPTGDNTDSGAPTATEAGLGSDQTPSGSNVLTQSVFGCALTAFSILATLIL
ncbi:hypothetical protein CLU79DRAFT_747171 [Phycomyces nitens]|nr:hypothetical protein CLU79DRAFT_747171 [Phycomyces nitens]